MGGGGGINPISLISALVFGPAIGALTALATSGMDSKQASDDGAEQAAREAQQAAADARARADRKKTEAALLAQARQEARADQASQDSLAGSLGAPQVAATGLKTRLGQ